MARRTIMEAAGSVVRLLTGVTELSGSTIRRAWTPQLQLSELRDGMVVSVVPAGVLEGVRDRSGVRDEFRVEVGIQAKLLAGDGEVSVDSLAQKAIAARDALMQFNALDLSDVVVKSAVIDPLCAHEHLVENRIFTAVITVRLVVTR